MLQSVHCRLFLQSLGLSRDEGDLLARQESVSSGSNAPRAAAPIWDEAGLRAHVCRRRASTEEHCRHPKKQRCEDARLQQLHARSANKQHSIAPWPLARVLNRVTLIMPLAGYILPALPNGDQRWREQQRSVGRLERNRLERRVRVRAGTRERARRNLQRSGWELAKAPRRRALARALARARLKRVRARALVRALVRAHAKAARARAERAKAEEVAAPARPALNPTPARTARSNHSAAQSKRPAEINTGPADHLKTSRSSPDERNGFLLPSGLSPEA
jgi:hypothetical protein